MTNDELVTANIGLVSRLLQAHIANPALLDNIPEGATVVIIPRNDPELAAANQRIAANLRLRGANVVLVSDDGRLAIRLLDDGTVAE